MASANKWLFLQLQKIDALEIGPTYSPLITVNKEGVEYKIYTPLSREYIISIDVVCKVIELGGNTISYPSWARVSSEALSYSVDHGINIFPHGRLLSILS